MRSNCYIRPIRNWSGLSLSRDRGDCQVNKLVACRRDPASPSWKVTADYELVRQMINEAEQQPHYRVVANGSLFVLAIAAVTHKQNFETAKCP